MNLKVTCTICGQPAHVPALEAGYEGHGHVTGWGWWCVLHRRVMRSILGTASSPGRPRKQPPAPRHRAIRRHHGYSAAPEMSAPRMPVSRPPVSEPPRMPRPGA